jgi:hypothetical protein
MTAIQKAMMGVIGIAMVTTLVLPNRQTAKVMGATGGAARGVLATAMGTGKAV